MRFLVPAQPLTDVSLMAFALESRFVWAIEGSLWWSLG